MYSLSRRGGRFSAPISWLSTHSDALALKCSGCVMLQVSCEPPSEPAVASMSFGYYYPISLFKQVWLNVWNASAHAQNTRRTLDLRRLVPLSRRRWSLPLGASTSLRHTLSLLDIVHRAEQAVKIKRSWSLRKPKPTPRRVRYPVPPSRRDSQSLDLDGSASDRRGGRCSRDGIGSRWDGRRGTRAKLKLNVT
jgi:hypothetical protein